MNHYAGSSHNRCETHGTVHQTRHLIIFYEDGKNHPIADTYDYCPNCEGELTPSELEKRLLEIGNDILKGYFPKHTPKATKVEIL